MDERDNLEPRGAVLDPARAAMAFSIRRYPPADALAPFVRHYWFLSWDLRDRPPHHQSTLTLPAVNAVIEADTDSVSGVWTKRFDRLLVGQGSVYGVLFRPAGFWPFYRRSMHALTDSAAPVAELLADPAPLRSLCFADVDDAARVVVFDTFLSALAPQRSADADLAGRWVDMVEQTPTIGRAEALAEAAGTSLRSLQRGLRTYVGAGPKQIIRRYRLLEAAALLARGEPVDQAELAYRLGYADQGHFVRDFGAAVGRPPGRYRAEQR